jgi:hypothetical protein
MSEDVKWCWYVDREEVSHGPFDSRDAAIADAHAEGAIASHDKIMVAHLMFPEASRYVLEDLDNVMERLEESAVDNDGLYAQDELIFSIKGNKEKAQKALDDALAGWADRYVKADIFFPDTKTEEDVTKILRLNPPSVTQPTKAPDDLALDSTTEALVNIAMGVADTFAAEGAVLELIERANAWRVAHPGHQLSKLVKP